MHSRRSFIGAHPTAAETAFAESKMASMVLAPLLFALLVVVAHSLPEDNLSTPELCKYWGYPVEVHDAVTKDGYVLALHRIPHGRKNGKVFIQSVFCSLLILICFL